MEISLPKSKATIERIAQETGRAPEQVVVDLVSNQLDYDTWFRNEVRKGIDSFDRGEFISDEEVEAPLDQLLRR